MSLRFIVKYKYTNKNILQKDYTKNQKFYQLKLPLNIEYMILANYSVRLLSQFVEDMDLADLYSTYSRISRNQVSPRKILKIIIYAYINKLYLSRDIESACARLMVEQQKIVYCIINF